MNHSLPEAVVAIDSLFDAACRSDQPGYVIAVAKDDVPIYRRAFGLASIEHAVANTPATRMRIGSATKHFTALGIMLLAEDGKLDPDASLRRYLPELSGSLGAPTLRELMNHMGGIRDPLDITALFLTEGLYPKLSVETVYRWSRRYNAMNHPPGRRWVYSNMGYTLLSFVIERGSGQTLAAFMRDRIFQPLGMIDTALVPDDMQVVPRLASFHMPAATGGFTRGIYPCELLGGGGIVSTVDDMLRWMQHLRHPCVVGSPETWATFQARPRFGSGAESDYCMGLRRQGHRGPEIVQHSGATLGSTCMMLTVPEHALDIIIMSNRMDSDPIGLSTRILELLLGDSLLPSGKPATLQGREAFTGLYLGKKYGLLVEIGGKDEGLNLSIAGGSAAPLFEREGDLVAESMIGPVVLHASARGVRDRHHVVELSNCGDREVFERLVDALPPIEDIARYLVGSYRLTDFDTPVTIVLEDRSLWIDLLSRYQLTRLRLEPVSGDVFRVAGNFLGIPFSGTVVLERDGDAAVGGFFLTTPRTWNLYFRRCAAEALRN